jgi:hypothetical protein
MNTLDMSGFVAPDVVVQNRAYRAWFGRAMSSRAIHAHE